MRGDLTAGKLNKLQRELFEPRPAEFLFDTHEDPWELHNLADDPRYQDQLIKMRTTLEQAILKSKDVMFLPEYELAEISKSGTAYEYRLDASRYPIDMIYDAAKFSGMRGQDILAKQVELLSHENKIVRYWAVLGLRSQEQHLLHAFRPQLMECMQDEYPPVKVTAAAIAYDVFADATAADILIEAASSTNPYLALMALNYLLYIADPQPFVESVQMISTMPDLNESVVWACEDFLTRIKNMN